MKKVFIIFVILLMTICALGQNIGINDDGSAPNSNAILDVKSTTKGYKA